MRAHRRRDEVVGDGARPQHREVVLRLGVDDDRVGLRAVVEGDADLLRAAHHVQVGQDGAVVDDDDAGADAALDHAVLLVVAAVVAFGHQADHAHDRGDHRLVGAGRRREQRLVLDRLAHGGVDLLHRQRRLHRQGRVAVPHAERQHRQGQRPDLALVPAEQRRQAAAPGERGRCRRGAGPRPGPPPASRRGAANGCRAAFSSWLASGNRAAHARRGPLSPIR